MYYVACVQDFASDYRTNLRALIFTNLMNRHNRENNIVPACIAVMQLGEAITSEHIICLETM